MEKDLTTLRELKKLDENKSNTNNSLSYDRAINVNNFVNSLKNDEGEINFEKIFLANTSGENKDDFLKQIIFDYNFLISQNEENIQNLESDLAGYQNKIIDINANGNSNNEEFEKLKSDFQKANETIKYMATLLNKSKEVITSLALSDGKSTKL